MTTGMDRIPAEAIAALERGELIEAIKSVRDATGLGLKQSKKLVDSLLNNDGLLQERYRAARPTANAFSLLIIASLIIVAWLIYRHVIGGR